MMHDFFLVSLVSLDTITQCNNVCSSSGCLLSWFNFEILKLAKVADSVYRVREVVRLSLAVIEYVGQSPYLPEVLLKW